MTGPVSAVLSSSLPSLPPSTPVNVNLAHAAPAGGAVQSHVIPGLFPSENFQSVSAAFPHPTTASTHSSSMQGFVTPDPNWMSYHGNPPMPNESLSPMSRFLEMTASNDEAIYNGTTFPSNSQLSTNPSSLIFFNSTNMANPAATSSPIFNPASINGANTTYATSFVRGSEPINGVAETRAQSALVPNEPENGAPGTNAESGKAPVKPRKRSRKDEVDTSYVLPEGTTRAYKPRQMADETRWEGTAPKRSRNQKS
jgi:hypothetical protein